MIADSVQHLETTFSKNETAGLLDSSPQEQINDSQGSSAQNEGLQQSKLLEIQLKIINSGPNPGPFAIRHPRFDFELLHRKILDKFKNHKIYSKYEILDLVLPGGLSIEEETWIEEYHDRSRIVVLARYPMFKLWLFRIMVCAVIPALIPSLGLAVYESMTAAIVTFLTMASVISLLVTVVVIVNSG